MSYALLAPFYDWVAPRFSRYRSPGLLAARVLELAPDPCELLDVGVGTGLSVAPYLESARFRRIVGIDPSRRMLERCRRKFPHLELHLGTLEERGCELGSFDVVQSCGAVEHVADLGQFVRRVASLLRPGGYFVFTYEPIRAGTVLQSAASPHIGTLGREKVFRRTPLEVEETLTAAGLESRGELEFRAYLGLLHRLVAARRR